jgi:hypothetical protein
MGILPVIHLSRATTSSEECRSKDERGGTEGFHGYGRKAFGESTKNSVSSDSGALLRMPSSRRRLPRSELGRFAVRCTKSVITGAATTALAASRVSAMMFEELRLMPRPNKMPMAQPAAAGAMTLA